MKPTNIALITFATSLSLFETSSSYAREWSASPQPLIVNQRAERTVMVADEASPIALDSSWRVLWLTKMGQLCGNFWNSRGKYFQEFSPGDGAFVLWGTPLVVDDRFHQVFFVGADGSVRLIVKS